MPGSSSELCQASPFPGPYGAGPQVEARGFITFRDCFNDLMLLLLSERREAIKHTRATRAEKRKRVTEMQHESSLQRVGGGMGGVSPWQCAFARNTKPWL